MVALLVLCSGCRPVLGLLKYHQMGMFAHLYKRIIEAVFVTITGLKLRCCCLVEVIFNTQMMSATTLTAGCSKEL